MSKRLTDTTKWLNPWFNSLEAKYKLFWIYALDNCDMAGVFWMDTRTISFHLGINITEEEIASVFDGKILEIDSMRYIIPSFIAFQYGALRTDSAVHRGVIKCLEKHGLQKGIDTLTKVLPNGYLTINNKAKNNNKANKKEKEPENIPDKNAHFDSLWERYPSKDGRKMALKHYLSSVITEQDRSDISTALDNYLASDRVNKGFIKNGSTWFNNWKDWVNTNNTPDIDYNLKQARELLERRSQ